MSPHSTNDVAREYAAAAAIIEQFVDGTGGVWDWDDFTSVRGRDAYLESVRLRCAAAHDEYPAATGYCSEAGVRVLLDIARDLRERARVLNPA